MTFIPLRQPRLEVLVGGQTIVNAVEAQIASDSYLGANRFSAQLAYQNDDLASWTTLPLQIAINVSVDGTSSQLILGYADLIELDAGRHKATVEGRDLTALFLTAQTSETFENQTSSQIAELLAQRRGLDASVSNTTDMVGRYYHSSRTRSALSQQSGSTSEWDILVSLASREGFDVWVDGMTLYFQAPQPPISPLTVSPDSCLGLKLRRALDIAAGVTIMVKSWDSQNAQVVSGVASNTVTTSTGSTMTANRPNLSAMEATQIARQTLSQYSTHEREISFETPGDTTTAPRGYIALQQTGTDFDGLYKITEVERSISFQRGFTQRVVARGLPWMPS